MNLKILKQSTPKVGKVQIQELLCEESLSSQTLPSFHDPKETTFHRCFATSPAPEPIKCDDLEEVHGKSSFLNQDTFFRAEDIVNDPKIAPHISTVFGNFQEARAYMRSLLTPNSLHDNTMPQDDAQRRALVGILFQAFKSTKLAVDNERSIRPFTDEVHDNRIVELRLWQLLNDIEATSNVQQSIHMACGGFSLWKGHVYKTFADRFNAVRYTLARNKCACVAVLNTPASIKLADDPLGYFGKAVENLRVNNAKASVIALGKKAKQQDNISLWSLSTNVSTKRKRNAASQSDFYTENPLGPEHGNESSGLNSNSEGFERVPLDKRARKDCHPAVPIIKPTQPDQNTLLRKPRGLYQTPLMHRCQDPFTSTTSWQTSHPCSTSHLPSTATRMTQPPSVATPIPSQQPTTVAGTETGLFHSQWLSDAQLSEYRIDQEEPCEFEREWNEVFGCNGGIDGNNNDDAHDGHDDFESLG